MSLKIKLNVFFEKVIKRIYTVVVSIVLFCFLWLFCVKNNMSETLSVLIILLAIIIYAKKIIGNRILIDERTPILIFLLTFGTRLMYCNFMNPIVYQVSDFGTLLYQAENGIFVDNLEYYRFFLHKFLYPFLLNKIGFTTQIEILVFQCLTVSFIPVVLFLMGKEMKNEKIGLLASIIYIVWPAQIIYTSIVTEEHLAALITVLIVYLFFILAKKIDSIYAVGERKNYVNIMVCFALIGILCGVSPFFKDWAIIILIAAFICSIYLFIKYSKVQRIILITGFLLIFGMKLVVSEGITSFAEEKLGVEASNGIIIAQMYESLDPNGEGTWDPVLMQEYQEIVKKHNFDFEVANDEAIGIIIDKVCNDFEKIPELLLKKGQNAYSSDYEMLLFALDFEMNQDYHQHYVGDIFLIQYISKVYYLFIVVCLLMACLCKKNRNIFFVLLIIVGAIASGLLIECQGRYKYSIEPIWCIVAANTIYNLCHSNFKVLKQRLKNLLCIQKN